jgi:hypothetical protein
MRWFKGLLFVLIALVSLGVVLFWPHPRYEATETYEGVINTAAIYQKSQVSSYGLPLIWLEVDKGERSPVTLQPGVTQQSGEPTNYEDKEIEASKLLINLIAWGVFMLLVELVLRGIYNKRNS